MILQSKSIQKGERDFINAVVRAVMECDVSETHYLLDCNGIIKCFSTDKGEGFTKVSLEDQGKKEAKVLCVFSEELIRDFHIKADGTDHLAKAWTRKAVKAIIAHGKMVSEETYKR